jgi:3-oxoacyl-[acyl-carrier protein] reductase
MPVIKDFTDEDFTRQFEINVRGTFNTLREAATRLADHGSIINFSSITPRCLVDILSKEIGHKGGTVNSIIPFAVDHSGIFADPAAYPRLRKQLIDSCPMGRLAEVEDVANAAEFFASDLSSFVSGQHLLVNGGATN